MLYKNFTKFILIGAANLILGTLILWFFIDIVGFKAVQVNPPLSVVVLFSKFWVYQKSKMFNPDNKRNFVLYLLINISAIVFSTLLLWIFVDNMGYFVGIVNPIIYIFTVSGRFIAFKIFGMLGE